MSDTKHDPIVIVGMARTAIGGFQGALAPLTAAELGGAAIKAALQRTATPLACPVDWQPLGPDDERFRCYGGGGMTSFFGHGLVDAARATS